MRSFVRSLPGPCDNPLMVSLNPLSARTVSKMPAFTEVPPLCMITLPALAPSGMTCDAPNRSWPSSMVVVPFQLLAVLEIVSNPSAPPPALVLEPQRLIAGDLAGDDAARAGGRAAPGDAGGAAQRDRVVDRCTRRAEADGAETRRAS